MVSTYLLEYYVFVRKVHFHSTRASSNDIIYPCRFKSEMENIYIYIYIYIYILALLLGINYLCVSKRYKLIIFLEG